MTSKYALVQFYPDPSSDERVDIGVIAWDRDGAHVLFIESWERMHSIDMEDVRLLQNYAESIQRRLSDRAGSHLDEETGELAADLIGDPAPRIRLTPARTAPEDAPTLISSLAAQFHYAPPPAPKRARDRRIAASHAYGAIMRAFRRRAPKEAGHLVHARHQLKGKLAEHEFDVVLALDEPLAAVNAMSFEIQSRRSLQREVDATAWALHDVHKLHRQMPLAVFILPPTNTETQALCRAATKIFKHVGARTISAEPAIARWALEQARGLAPFERRRT